MFEVWILLGLRVTALMLIYIFVGIILYQLYHVNYKLN